MFSTNWDINKYRDTSETDEQWELRKAFMTKWKSDFDEDRVVCLAKLFINIEFLGCRYPSKVQDLVERLSSEIARNYRDRKKNRLSRFFVSATVAAADRAKGVKRKNDSEDSSPLKRVSFVAEKGTIDDNSSTVIRVTNLAEDFKDKATSFDGNPSDIAPLVSRLIPPSRPFPQNVSNPNISAYNRGMLNTEYGKLVLIARTWCSDFENLRLTANEFGLKLDCVEESGKCQIMLNDRIIGSGSGFSKAEAKTEAASKAWKELSSKCVSLIHKKAYSSSEETLVRGADLSRTGSSAHSTEQSQFGTAVESSIATKMMKVMGWDGGALGANSDGITQPIMPNTQQVHRAGLGSDSAGSFDGKFNNKQFGSLAHGLMRRFASNENSSVTDLIFSTDFSKEERVLLHVAARKAGLTSRSYGKDSDRFLVVRKPSNPLLIVEEVIRNGGSTDKYSVIVPDSPRRS